MRPSSERVVLQADLRPFGKNLKKRLQSRKLLSQYKKPPFKTPVLLLKRRMQTKRLSMTAINLKRHQT